MEKKSFRILFVVAAFVALNGQTAKSGLQTASDRNGAYYTGVYRNLFSELLGKNDSEIKSKLDTSFNHLFFGNDSTQRVYYPVGNDMAYVEDVGDADVRTEGMSYGMMIAVQMDRKDVFDRLWNWANTYMRVKDGPQKGYFAWQCKTDGSVISSSTASDGEEWFAMSLFFASARWGDGKGIYNYREQAQDLLNAMLHKESESGHDGVTNLFNSEKHLVVFVPDQRGSKFTDPSYQVPHYCELWARWAQNDNRFWCDAAEASRELLRNSANPVTGLSPDYSNFDGKPYAFWGVGHEDFRFDAWRVAMNIGLDYEWFHKDEWEVTECNRLLDFFATQGLNGYVNQFSLDGKNLGGDHSKGLVAMNAVAALASTDTNRKDFVNALWNAKVPTGLYRYYDGMLYMMALLQVSGNFRIYDPTGKPVPACEK